MTDHRPTPFVERPKIEPEIIPPGSSGGRSAWIRLTTGDRRARLVHLEAHGPFAIIVGLLLLGVASLILIALLLGAVLLWIPLILGFAVALVGSRLFRGRSR